MNEIKGIIELIEKSKSIALIYHINADGDAIGSALALQLAFSSLGKIIDVFGEEEVSSSYKFLPGSEKIIVGADTTQTYDLAIALDLGELKRLGARAKIYNAAKNKANIDHHIHNTLESDAKFVVENAAASGELVYKIIKQAGRQITKEIATCLFVAISTDSGSFKFSNTSSETHRIAAELIDCGVDSGEVSNLVYNNVPFERQKLLGEVLTLMELHLDGKAAFLEISYELIQKYAIKMEELDNIANYGTSICGVELAILFKEVEPNQIKMSLRSKEYFHCSDFARNFDGGGHARAAGGSLNMPLKDAKRVVLEKIKFDR